MMTRFCQPSDYHYKGRNIWFNPIDVMRIERGETLDQCVLILRNGESFTIAMNADKAAEEINAALKEGK